MQSQRQERIPWRGCLEALPSEDSAAGRKSSRLQTAAERQVPRRKPWKTARADDVSCALCQALGLCVGGHFSLVLNRIFLQPHSASSHCDNCKCSSELGTGLLMGTRVFSLPQDQALCVASAGRRKLDLQFQREQPAQPRSAAALRVLIGSSAAWHATTGRVLKHFLQGWPGLRLVESQNL